LESGTLSEPEFAEFAKDVTLFLHITTRITGRKDEDLLSKVGGRGFPHLVAMDATGKLFGSPNDRTVESFRKLMTVVSEYGNFKAKAEKGDAVAKVEFFIRALKVGDFKKLDEAKKHLATLKKVSKEQKTEIDGLLYGLEVRDIVEPLNQNKDDGKKAELTKSVGKKLVEMDKAGHLPAMDEDFGVFYSVILSYAEQEKDIPLFEKGLEALKARFGDNLNQRFLSAKEQILEKMKDEKEGK